MTSLCGAGYFYAEHAFQGEKIGNIYKRKGCNLVKITGGGHLCIVHDKQILCKNLIAK